MLEKELEYEKNLNFLVQLYNGGDFMVYCHNCGTKNEDDAEFCSKCAEPLKRDDNDRSDRYRRRDDRYRRREDCFGLPYGNMIVPLIFGVILILVGLSSFYGFQIWQYLWPAIIIVFGLLIILGAVLGRNRRR